MEFSLCTISESGGDSATIAGDDSVLVSTFGTISQEDIAALSTNSGGILIMAMMEYCDAIGTYSKKNFVLTYRPNAPSYGLGFSLLSEGNQVPLTLPATTTTEHLFPCEMEPKPKDQ
jgi:hypothetical protein